MKTQSLFAILALSATIVACGNGAPEETVETNEAQEVSQKAETSVDYALASDANTIRWVGFKTFTDSRHTGTIQVKEGNFHVENGELVGGTFVIDMNSIANEDVPVEGEYNRARLEGHLKSEDFFHVEAHPTATFEITNVEVAPNEEKGTTHAISGNLTLRGETKNITFPASVNLEGDQLVLNAPEFAIDRTNWKVQALSTSIEGLAKENLVDNNILLHMELRGSKQ
ncbi:MAG: YceI family protein [Bacteroidota bacterium]|nr:YceI family protein [Bacteroidota bacterium]MDX5404244.1 YceI family protein [Bacteroidota bacterium]MDX5428720.1 YceI family protein [Bacteroidota bacterium]MDX5448853.1 YceI family protein [Bacteroidota bacterium]MDX5506448.1 YceI family protein [Bacteroidota bacterium]